jgi:hypothetical protein
VRGTPGRISKHRQFDIEPPYKHIPGEVRVMPNSSLRKLMRAARRGKMPDDRQVIMDVAHRRAAERADAYLNSSPAKRSYRRQQAYAALRA